MDAALDFVFTNPKDESKEPLANDLLYFAAICAGPGAFSEYVLWRNGWRDKGFEFTLRRENDSELNYFFGERPETFETYYGIGEGGDLYKPDNIQSLRSYVLEQTSNAVVRVDMGEGGFQVEEKIESTQLYLCQCVTALLLLRRGGSCVVKVFDIFTSFSVGLVYLMHKSFRQLCIIKPKSSRGANLERHLVFKSKLANTESIEQYLLDVNRKFNDVKVVQLVPFDVFDKDDNFVSYIWNSNNKIAQYQNCEK